MKADGGGLLGFVVSSPSLSLIVLSNIFLLRCYVSEFSSDMIRGLIYRLVTIVALGLSTTCDISLPSFLMTPGTRPRHSFASENDFGVL